MRREEEGIGCRYRFIDLSMMMPNSLTDTECSEQATLRETAADSLHSLSYQFACAGRHVHEDRHQADFACVRRCFVTRLSAARLVFARGDAAGFGGAGLCQCEGACHLLVLCGWCAERPSFIGPVRSVYQSLRDCIFSANYECVTPVVSRSIFQIDFLMSASSLAEHGHNLVTVNHYELCAEKKTEQKEWWNFISCM